MFRTIINKLQSAIKWPQRSAHNEPAQAFSQMDIETAHKAIIDNAVRFGFPLDGETVSRRLSELDGLSGRSNVKFMLVQYEVSTLLEVLLSTSRGMDPSSGHIGTDPAMPGIVVVFTRPDEQGNELFEAVVRTQLGDLLKDVARVVVDSHVTRFFDAAGKPIVGFIAAGRKMHYGYAFRAYNASKALALVGITMSVEDIAIPDLSSSYPKLVFERQDDGSWKNKSEELTKSL